MCDTIFMAPLNKEIRTIREDKACLCNSTEIEIFTWIVQNIGEKIQIGQQLVIEKTPFDYDVRIEKGLREIEMESQRNEKQK